MDDCDRDTWSANVSENLSRMHRHYVLKYIYPGRYSRPSCRKKFSRERLGNRTGPAPPPTSPRKTHSCAQLSLLFPILKLVPLGGAGQDTRKRRLREGRPQGGARAGDRFPAHLARRKGGAFAGSRQPSSVLTELSGRRSSPGQRQPGPSVLPRCRSASGRSRPQPPGRPGLCPSGLSVPGACLLFWFLRPMSQFFLERQPGAPNPVQAGLSMVGLHTCVFFLSLLWCVV